MAGMAGGQKTSSGYITLQDDLLFGIIFDPITLFGSDGAQEVQNFVRSSVRSAHSSISVL